MPPPLFDSMVGVMQEHGVALSGSHVADVGDGAEQIPAAGTQLHQKRGAKR